MRRSTALALLLVAGCGDELPEDQLLSQYYGVTVCPKDVVEGIDVSHWQGAIDWAKVRASGKRFVFMKATESTGYVDPTFARNWAAAKSAGLLRGAYHFFRANADPVQQADHFLKIAGAGGELPLVADVETADGQSGATIAQRALAFMARIEQKTGRAPLVYLSPGFFGGTLGNPKGFDAYPLWVAHWGVNCPNVPGQWKTFRVWQYSAKGSVSGISGDVDLNRFNGTLAELMAWGGMGNCTPSCAMKMCGSDGCGGNCGQCPKGSSCVQDSRCVASPDLAAARDLAVAQDDLAVGNDLAAAADLGPPVAQGGCSCALGGRGRAPLWLVLALLVVVLRDRIRTSAASRTPRRDAPSPRAARPRRGWRWSTGGRTGR